MAIALPTIDNVGLQPLAVCACARACVLKSLKDQAQTPLGVELCPLGESQQGKQARRQIRGQMTK